MWLVSSEASFKEGQGSREESRQQKMEVERKKNPIYIFEVANVPCCTSFPSRESLFG